MSETAHHFIKDFLSALVNDEPGMQAHRRLNAVPALVSYNWTWGLFGLLIAILAMGMGMWFMVTKRSLWWNIYLAPWLNFVLCIKFLLYWFLLLVNRFEYTNAKEKGRVWSQATLTTIEATFIIVACLFFACAAFMLKSTLARSTKEKEWSSMFGQYGFSVGFMASWWFLYMCFAGLDFQTNYNAWFDYLGMLVLWWVSIIGGSILSCIGSGWHDRLWMHIMFHSMTVSNAMTYGIFRCINVAMCGFIYSGLDPATPSYIFNNVNNPHQSLYPVLVTTVGIVWPMFTIIAALVQFTVHKDGVLAGNEIDRIRPPEHNPLVISEPRRYEQPYKAPVDDSAEVSLDQELNNAHGAGIQ